MQLIVLFLTSPADFWFLCVITWLYRSTSDFGSKWLSTAPILVRWRHLGCRNRMVEGLGISFIVALPHSCSASTQPFISMLDRMERQPSNGGFTSSNGSALLCSRPNSSYIPPASSGSQHEGFAISSTGFSRHMLLIRPRLRSSHSGPGQSPRPEL
jgi:hypothetical protein